MENKWFFVIQLISIRRINTNPTIMNITELDISDGKAKCKYYVKT